MAIEVITKEDLRRIFFSKLARNPMHYDSFRPSKTLANVSSVFVRRKSQQILFDKISSGKMQLLLDR